jgi:aminopeptidase N
MRLGTLISIILLFSLLINAQQYQKELNEKEEFRREEFKNAMKKFDVKSSQVTKSDATIDALYYEIKLDLDFTAQDISYGEVTGRFSSKVDSLSQISLDFDDNMSVDSIDGNAVSFTHSGYTLIINLDQTYNLNDIFEVTVYYNGAPNSSGFGSWGMNSSRASTLSEPYGAREWWPCKDTPTDKPDSVDIHITVPVGYIAVSNGTLISVTPAPGSKNTYHWHEQYPITTYLVSIAVANDYVHFSDFYVNTSGDTLSLDYWVYTSELSQAQATYAEVPLYIEALEHFFGPYPFFEEKYGMARFDWGGAVEHQTVTSTGSVSNSWWWRHTNVHELGHQWFGDQITCANFHHIWLNEGFASYSEALFEEYANGISAYHNYMRNYLVGGWSGKIYVDDTTNTWNIFNSTVYDKGAWVVHMLRHVIGDSVFFQTLKSFLTDPRFTYGAATTKDLRTVYEEITGLNLHPFFVQWIYHPSYPSYQYAWSITQSGNKWITNLLIKQVQTHHIYTMPIDITLQGSGWDSTVVVLNDTAYQRYYIESSVEPTNVLFDKDNWILRNVQLVVDGILDPEKYPPNTFVLEQNYPNPFNPETNFKFYSPYQANVDLIIYDISGRVVKSFYFNTVNNGFNEVKWDSRNDLGQEVASGVYFYQLVSKENTMPNVRKLIKID